jgi:hypothetical protein
MTEPRTNRLLGAASAFRGKCPPFVSVEGSDEQVPTEIHAYCAWLNSKEHRRGTWIVVKIGNDDESARKGVDWRPEVASDDWLREKGLIPQIGRAA